MDTLASLALATEPPCDELLKRKPYSKREGLITSQMWKFLISQGIMQIIILGTILFKGTWLFIQAPKSSEFQAQLESLIGTTKQESTILSSSMFSSCSRFSMKSTQENSKLTSITSSSTSSTTNFSSSLLWPPSSSNSPWSSMEENHSKQLSLVSSRTCCACSWALLQSCRVCYSRSSYLATWSFAPKELSSAALSSTGRRCLQRENSKKRIDSSWFVLINVSYISKYVVINQMFFSSMDYSPLSSLLF